MEAEKLIIPFTHYECARDMWEGIWKLKITINQRSISFHLCMCAWQVREGDMEAENYNHHAIYVCVCGYKLKTTIMPFIFLFLCYLGRCGRGAKVNLVAMM